MHVLHNFDESNLNVACRLRWLRGRNLKMFVFAFVGLVLGVLIGLPMGVVGYGMGLGGAYVFGPIGLVIGALSALALRR